MTMLESKKAFEDALFNKRPLPYDAMINAYVAIQNFLAGCDNKDTKVDINTSKMEEIPNHGKVKKIFKGSHFDYGYYAFIDRNGDFVIGEERGREGGELYRGVYKGENTPWLNDIKKENIKLYNSIVSNLAI